MTEDDIFGAIDYIVIETIKDERLKIIEEKSSVGTHNANFLAFWGIPTAQANCLPTTNPNYKQLSLDINGGTYDSHSFNSGNNLYLVSHIDNTSTCELTYKLYFYDEDHPTADEFYDNLRKLIWNRVHDIESFTIKNNNMIKFDNTWSSTNDYDCTTIVVQMGCHETTNKVYTSGQTVYVSNTWNHMMDTSDTNGSYTKVTVP